MNPMITRLLDTIEVITRIVLDSLLIIILAAVVVALCCFSSNDKLKLQPCNTPNCRCNSLQPAPKPANHTGTHSSTSGFRL